MTPRPRRYLFLSLVGTCLFAVLAVLVEADTALVRLDARLVAALHQLAADRPAVYDFFASVTNLGSGRPLGVVGSVAILALAVRREWFRALVWAVGLLGANPVTGLLKPRFARVHLMLVFGHHGSLICHCRYPVGEAHVCTGRNAGADG